MTSRSNAESIAGGAGQPRARARRRARAAWRRSARRARARRRSSPRSSTVRRSCSAAARVGTSTNVSRACVRRQREDPVGEGRAKGGEVGNAEEPGPARRDHGCGTSRRRSGAAGRPRDRRGRVRAASARPRRPLRPGARVRRRPLRPRPAAAARRSRPAHRRCGRARARSTASAAAFSSARRRPRSRQSPRERPQALRRRTGQRADVVETALRRGERLDERQPSRVRYARRPSIRSSH